MNDDVNCLPSDYNNACIEVLDVHAPANISWSRRERCRPGWYNETVDSARRERRRCERRWRKSKSDVSHAEYLASKKMVKETISHEKSEFYLNRLSNCSSKDMYKTVNELLNKQSKPLPDCKSPTELANKFGYFFTDKVSKIRGEFDKSGAHSYACENPNVYDDNISSQVAMPTVGSSCNAGSLDCTSSPSSNTKIMSMFNHVSQDEVLEIVNNCPNKSCILDPIPSWLIKKHVHVLLPTLTRIVNVSLSSGTFPDDLQPRLSSPLF